VNASEQFGATRWRKASSALVLGGLLAATIGAPHVQAQTYTVLHNFSGGADGGNPGAGVIRDSAGNFYGAVRMGGCGNHPCCLVFKLNLTAGETALDSFPGAPNTGNASGVIRDSAGNLYGTTQFGGTVNASCPSGCGVVYKVDSSGNPTVLYAFAGGADGANPAAGVIRDLAGNVYGTTQNGGTASASCASGCGVVYKLDTLGNESVLYSFTGGADGANPDGGVILDLAGNLYGTTHSGGTVVGTPCQSGCGVVYKLDPLSNETVLHSFTGGADGMFPAAGVVRDGAGNLYGTTPFGGAGICPGSCGTVYKVDTSGNETVLHNFIGGFDGALPYAGLILDSAGNLYGTASSAGTGNVGVVYKLDASGNETILYNFMGIVQPGGGVDGYAPFAGVILDKAGNLYGTTASGGKYRKGVVYKLTP